MRLMPAIWVGLMLSGAVAAARGQANPDTIKIVTPVVDKAAGSVTLPANFWNMHEADWVETALTGRPSDFLHETVVAVTTTRTLLTQALRDAGCRDADAWADSIKDYPRIRGDRLLITATFERAGKKETFSLDELLSFTQWNTAVGPFGFMFKGNPGVPRNATASATTTAAADRTLILRDDPQIALEYKGLQARTQSFADHPLAYLDDDWEWGDINRTRNTTALPREIFDANEKLAVTLTLKRVTDEQLLTESAKLWHDAGFADAMTKQLPTAKRIDQNKAEYLKLRAAAKELLAAPVEARDAGKQHGGLDRLAVLTAEIQSDYAALDAAWAAYAAVHQKLMLPEAADQEIYKKQAVLWREFLQNKADQAKALAAAERAAYEQKSLTLAGTAESDPKIIALKGAEFRARADALGAGTRSTAAYWLDQLDRVKKQNPPPAADDFYVKIIQLRVTLNSARAAAAAAGATFGTAQSRVAPPAELSPLKKASDTAALQLLLAQAQLDLAMAGFEVRKREGIDPADPELLQLKREQATLAERITALQAALKPE